MPQLRPVDLEGRVALVAGGTGEVGAAFVDLLGSAGAEVAVVAAAGPELELMAIRLGVETVESDPADLAALSAATRTIAERLGRVDLLVYVRESAAPLQLTAADLRDCAGAMGAGEPGRRILLVGPKDSLPWREVRAAATDLAPEAVTVNALRHGPLRPPEPDDWQDDEAARTAPVGTVRATDLPRAAVWLLDPEVEDVTGCVVDLDA